MQENSLDPADSGRPAMYPVNSPGRRRQTRGTFSVLQKIWPQPQPGWRRSGSNSGISSGPPPTRSWRRTRAAGSSTQTRRRRASSGAAAGQPSLRRAVTPTLNRILLACLRTSVPGTLLAACCHPDAQPDIARMLADLRAGKACVSQETTLRSRNGAQVRVAITAAGCGAGEKRWLIWKHPALQGAKSRTGSLQELRRSVPAASHH